MADMREVGPTYYFAPPRVLEALLTQVSIRMDDASLVKRWLYRKFMEVAHRVGGALLDGGPVSALDRLSYWLGDVVVYAPLRNVLGMSRVRVGYTAGEAIGPDLCKFYRSIGINLKQLYGSTETAVFVCLQPDGQVKPDTVGPAVPGVELKFSGARELLVRSPGLFAEYYKNPGATAQAKDRDGWFHTGDAGFFDAQGHVKIIDRVKDVGKLHDGTLFAPKYLENKLKFFLDVREELELVLEVFRGEQGAVVQLAHVLHAVDDLDVPLGVEEARIPGVEPAVAVLGLGSRARVLVVLREQPGRAHEQLTRAAELELHARHRPTDGVGLDLPVGLQADEHRCLGGTVELLQVDADRAVELAQVRADGFSRGIAHSDAAHAQDVAQRGIDHDVAQPVAQAIQGGHRLAVEQGAAHAVRDLHEFAVEPAFDAARIVHPDGDLRQQRLEDARRRKIISRSDLAHVGHDCLGRLRAADAIAGDEGLCAGKDVLTDPCRRKVGKDHVVRAELVERRGRARGADQAGMRVDHAFRGRGSSGSEEQRRDIAARALRDARFDACAVARKRIASCRQQLVVAAQQGLRIVTHAARIVEIDAPQVRALGKDLEELVDLLLVLGEGEGDLGVLDGKRHLGRNRILVQRHRNRAQALHRGHGRVQPWPVVAHQRDVLPPCSPS